MVDTAGQAIVLTFIAAQASDFFVALLQINAISGDSYVTKDGKKPLAPGWGGERGGPLIRLQLQLTAPMSALAPPPAAVYPDRLPIPASVPEYYP